MKVHLHNDLNRGQYTAQVDKPILTVEEKSKLDKFGEPYIQIGGTFTGTVTRSGLTDTTLAVTGGGGSGAALIPVLNGQGGIESVTITSGGSGYVSTPAIGITGVGTGASLTPIVAGGIITGVTVASSGYGYQKVTANVNFTLPSTLRRMLTDFPVSQVFSLDDSYDADANAQIWLQSIESNLIYARNVLMAQSNILEAETLQTV